MPEVAAEHDRSIPETEVQLPFLMSGYLMGVYFQTIGDVDFDNGFISKPLGYERRAQRAIATDQFMSSDINRNIFVLVCNGREENGGASVARVLQLLTISVR